MDTQKAAFIFGELLGDEDPDDEEVRHRLVEKRVLAERLALGGGMVDNLIAVAVRQTIADQIAGDTPAEVWTTSRRLLDEGLPPTLVMANLTMASFATWVDSVADDQPLDEADYVEKLDLLPLPPVREVSALFRGLAGQRRSVPADDLVTTAMAFFADGDVVTGEDAEGDGAEHWVELAVDRIMEEDSVVMLPPDLMVHVPTLMDGATFTH